MLPFIHWWWEDKLGNTILENTLQICPLLILHVFFSDIVLQSAFIRCLIYKHKWGSVSEMLTNHWILIPNVFWERMSCEELFCLYHLIYLCHQPTGRSAALDCPPPFFSVKKQRHTDITQLAEVIEPELGGRSFDFRVIIPHGVSCVRKACWEVLSWTDMVRDEGS